MGSKSKKSCLEFLCLFEREILTVVFECDGSEMAVTVLASVERFGGTVSFTLWPF